MTDQATAPKTRTLLGPEDVGKWHRAAMRALGNNDARRKWADSKPGGPVTVMLLCEDVSRLQRERGEMLAAIKKVYADLNLRIDAAVEAGEAIPVFVGIADLHEIIGNAEVDAISSPDHAK